MLKYRKKERDKTQKLIDEKKKEIVRIKEFYNNNNNNNNNVNNPKRDDQIERINIEIKGMNIERDIKINDLDINYLKKEENLKNDKTKEINKIINEINNLK
jgi:hypothetical protein